MPKTTKKESDDSSEDEQPQAKKRCSGKDIKATPTTSSSTVPTTSSSTVLQEKQDITALVASDLTISDDEEDPDQSPTCAEDEIVITADDMSDTLLDSKLKSVSVIPNVSTPKTVEQNSCKTDESIKTMKRTRLEYELFGQDAMSTQKFRNTEEYIPKQVGGSNVVIEDYKPTPIVKQKESDTYSLEKKLSDAKFLHNKYVLTDLYRVVNNIDQNVGDAMKQALIKGGYFKPQRK